MKFKKKLAGILLILGFIIFLPFILIGTILVVPPTIILAELVKIMNYG